jgi:3D (Asp-Asp-Asp) domain-containing protein
MRYKKHFFLLLTISALSTSAACTSFTSLQSGCSDNWRVTGYYTPVEDDYQGGKQKIKVRNTGMVSIKKTFLRHVKLEGWGKTSNGWYLGYYDGAWHKSTYPLNSKGQALQKGMVAVDSSMVPLYSRIRIPGLDLVLGQQIFTASDVGTAVRDKHVDIYTGEGAQAKKLAYDITGPNTVCL